MSGKITDKELSPSLVKKINDLHDFLTKGGNIGNTVTIGDNINKTEFRIGHSSLTGKSMSISMKDKEKDNVDIGLNFNVRPGVSSDISPYKDNEVDLGRADYRFKDIWVGYFHRSWAGYIKLANGMLLQWGRDPANTSSANIVFPVAFLESCFIVNCQLDGLTNSMLTTMNITNKSFTLTISNPAQQQHTVMWIAIGK